MTALMLGLVQGCMVWRELRPITGDTGTSTGDTGTSGLPPGLPGEPSGRPRPPLDPVRVDTIVQTAPAAVDVLFVVDNSCSMGTEQEDLTINFSAFFQYLQGSGIDYHIGVTSTDMDGGAGSFGLNGSQGRLREVSGVRWIDPSTPNSESVFSAMVVMGTNGSAFERGTDAVYAALEEQRNTANAGFYRDEAALHAVIVSDEANTRGPDSIPLAELVEWFDGLKPRASERSFSALVNQSGGEYRTVSNQLGGISWDLSSGRWSVVLDQLGQLTSGRRAEFFLSGLPVEDTLMVEVFVPGEAPLQVVPAEFDKKGTLITAGPAFDFHPARNAVQIINYLPEPLATVRVTYDDRRLLVQ